jgi:hypothetical protein
LARALIAISAQTPDNTLTTVEKKEPNLSVLSDVGNVVARKYGLVFVTPKPLGTPASPPPTAARATRRSAVRRHWSAH